MRTITSTLLAAARSLHGQPSVTARISDKRLRWSLLHWDDGSSRWTAMVAEGTTIHRVRSDGSGNIQTAIVTDPATKAQWTTWTTRTAEGIANSDVGMALAGSTLRIVYVKSGYDVRTITSGDSGATWSTPETIVSGLGGAPYVATTNGAVFVLTGGQVRVYTKPAGSWVLQSTLTALTLTSPQGVAADYDSAGGKYRVVIAGDGKVHVATCDAATYAWDSPL